jgi:hypothetical protein
MTKDNAIYTNAPYAVHVVRDFKSGKDRMDIYGVINTETGVQEAEMRTYPGAITAADHLAAEFAKLQDDGAEDGETVIEFTPDLRTVN